MPESADERTFAPSCDRRPGHAVGRWRRVDRDERRQVGKLRPAPPRDRPDLPLWRAGDLGSRAGQPHRPADDPRRAHLVHRDPRPIGDPARQRDRPCARRHLHGHPRSRSSSPIRAASWRRASIGSPSRSWRSAPPPLNILFSTSLPLIADKSTGLYGGLALATLSTGVVVRRWLIAPPRARRELAPVLVAGMVFLASLIINLVRRIADLPEGVEAILLAVTGSGAGGDPGRPAGRLLSSERAAVAGARRCHPGPDVPLHAGRPVHRLDRERTATAIERPVADADVLVGRRLYERMFAEAPDDRARRLPIWRSRPASCRHTTSRSPCPTGTRDFEARIAPSGPVEVTAIVRDFTDQRAAEAELRRSRARIVEATDEERRRLERDLHDGAQQRLVSLVTRAAAPADASRGCRTAAMRRRSLPPTRPQPSSSSRSRSFASSPAGSIRRS